MPELEKIKFVLEGGELNGETTWAEPVEENLYRIRNIPFLAKGYAENDIVRTKYRDGWQEVVRLEIDSGNGTVLLLFNDANETKVQEI